MDRNSALPFFFTCLLIFGGIPGAVQASHVDDFGLIDSFVNGDNITVSSFDVDVDVTDGVAVTRFAIDAVNEGSLAQEATFSVPLPLGAAITGFNLTVNDTVLHGRIIEKQQARQEYDEAKSRGEDAVLLEQADESALVMSMNLRPGESRLLQLAYVEFVGFESGARSYRLPLGNLQNGSMVEEARVQFEIFGQQPEQVLYPSLHLDRGGNGSYRAEWEGAGDDAEDLVVTWTENREAWYTKAIPSTGPEGAGALFVTATWDADEAANALPRDMVFVIDKSGSMDSEGKIGQARESVREVLLTLRPDDRFAVVSFSNGVSIHTDGLVAANSDNIQQARQEVTTIRADGGTDLDAGLQQALTTLGQSGDNLPLVVFLTDGLPTVGITNHQQIVSRMEANNHRQAAVHLLAIGLDADGTFMEDLAARSGGSLTTLQPGDDLQERLEEFYASLEDPLLTDIVVAAEPVGNGTFSEPLPTKVKVMYRDDTIQAAFLMSKGIEGKVGIDIDGVSADGAVSKQFIIDLSPPVPEVNRFWGAYKVSELLSEERRIGYNETLRQQIVNTSIEHGIITPYTSWIITENRPEQDVAAATPAASPAGTSADYGDDVAYESAAGEGEAAESSKSQPAPGVLLAALGIVMLAFVMRRRNGTG